jgi:UDP-N-acetylglucosamine 2-epimerase (non-hydrolysing)
MEPVKPWSVCVVAGTRPEIIKLAKVVRVLNAPDSPIDVVTCLSGQHVELADGALAAFGADFPIDSDLRGLNPSSGELTAQLAELMLRIGEVLDQARPTAVIVQGDTNTTLAAALAAFHREVPVVHIEAGLRTRHPLRPFPEEMNRSLVSRVATLHCAPTESARQHLLEEGIADAHIVVTGNPGIDALRAVVAMPDRAADDLLVAPAGMRTLLVTLHRRESIDATGAVIAAVRTLLAGRPELRVLWISHSNAVRHELDALIRAGSPIRVLPPQPYTTFSRLLAGCDLVLTDSGGVQEEAPALGRPVLVLGEATERPEGVKAGAALLTGCDPDRIVAACSRLLDDPHAYAAATNSRELYGDGHAAPRIASAVTRLLREREQAARCASTMPRRRELWVAGFPSPYGGADTELDHQITLWRRHDVDVHLVPMFGADEQTRVRMLARGCHVHTYRDDIFRGKRVVSFCNGEFLNHLPRIMARGRPAQVIWFNCMTWLFDAEREAHRQGFIDVFGFVSAYQRAQLEPQLRAIRDNVGTFDYRPFFDTSETEWRYRPWEGSYRLGRISRDDSAKFSGDTWRIFDRVITPPGLAKKVYILGYGPNAAGRIGPAPLGLDWQTWGPSEIPASDFYRTIDTLIHKTGGSRESYCRVVIEAYAHGVVPIVEDDYAFPEIVMHGETGFRCSDSDEMSWHASLLARDPERHRAMAERGRAFLTETLSDDVACWRGWASLW